MSQNCSVIAQNWRDQGARRKVGLLAALVAHASLIAKVINLLTM